MKYLAKFVDDVRDGLDRVQVDDAAYSDLYDTADEAVRDGIGVTFTHRGVTVEVSPLPDGNVLGMVRVIPEDAEDECIGHPEFARIAVLESLPRYRQPAAMARTLQDLLHTWSRHLEVTA